ncbi:DUF4091 domain-containing protein [Pedobacter cryoconitis]|uniref:Glycoside hydrolase 123 C-terminal domain-containing protein n=1 Tax=Pedobacter cryoconitis TaxID=188932 RepID=A0A7X0J498_9SPHI|nr:DUF4091 domain-containing protein [Pedobacter cryoconitis]MBB6499361.1 hypothetical protein [Pedobacter cryoconitis]
MKYLVFICFSCLCLIARAQDVSLALQKKAPLNSQTIHDEWNKVANGLNVSFASANVRFARELPPKVELQSTWETKAWKGEKIHTQMLVWANKSFNAVSLQLYDLKDKDGHLIKKENITAGFIQYVITDEFKNGCGYRKTVDFDSSYVADAIDTKSASIMLKENNTQPIWLSIKVPANTTPGNYKGSIKIKGDKDYSFPISIEVLNKTLPAASKWQYDLDLWQHPAAIARVHKLPLWSPEHFSMMKKYYQMLADAGQKTITASIVNEPWGHQTYDDYPSLIKWTKKKDGSWSYDYSLFDKYVAFVMDCGITERINCYSMVPWKIAFTYYDETLQQEAVFTDAIGTPTYNVFWKTMLVDFTKHLKQKGWFGKTYIAMDERPMDTMIAVIKLLKETDKDWKIALAGDYHTEIEKDIDVYCVASRWDFPAATLQRRRQEGKVSTWYTCCTEPYPNGFTFSSPAEGVWMGWYTANKNLDGYLRWAYNSWTKDPMADSRFTAWPAGDTYQVYPGPLSSVRFEKLIEGAQDFEKIKQLKIYYKKNNLTKELNELNKALEIFEIKSLANTTADEMLKKVKPLLNR